MTRPDRGQTLVYKRSFSALLIPAVALLVGLARYPETRPIAILLSVMAALLTTHLVGVVLAAVLAGTPIEKVALFNGPRLVLLNVRHVELSLNLIPMSASVSLPGFGFSGGEACEGGFGCLHMKWRLTISAAGPLALFLIGCACIGAGPAAESVARGFYQVAVGAFAPLSHGQSLLRQAESLIVSQQLVTTLGVLAAKFCAISLLPIPSTNGGRLVMELFRSKISEQTARRLNITGLIISMVIFIGWSVAGVALALHSLRSS